MLEDKLHIAYMVVSKFFYHFTDQKKDLYGFEDVEGK